MCVKCSGTSKYNRPTPVWIYCHTTTLHKELKRRGRTKFISLAVACMLVAITVSGRKLCAKRILCYLYDEKYHCAASYDEVFFCCALY